MIQRDDNVQPTASGAVDPISIAVARASLVAVAREIFTVFERTALLPLLYEVHDFGISIFDHRMNLVADAPGVPEFVGSLDFALEAIIQHFDRVGPLQPDDVVITTHPFLTGNHPPDASMIVPAFADGQLVGYCGLKAHMGDLGAKDTYPMDSRSVYDEGLMLPPLRLYAGGRLNTDIVSIIETNSRMPRETTGNILAAAAALRLGAGKLSSLVERFGMDVYVASVDQLLEQGERDVRSVIEAFPDGVYTAEDMLDDNGIEKHQVPLKCTVTISGSEIAVDTTGSASQQEGPFNSTLPMTMAACRLALKRLTTEDRLPSNSGEHRPLTVIAPEGSIFHAVSPAATFEMALTAQRLGEMILTALLPAAAGRIPGPSMGDATMISGVLHLPSGALTFLDCIALIGYGATADHDGMTAFQHFPLAGLKMSSAEITEVNAPVVMMKSELCQDSGGAGRQRGGLGTRLEWRVFGTGRANMFGEKLSSPEAPGEDGGRPAGIRNIVTINAGTQDEVVAGKQAQIPLNPGDVIVLQGGSGAGYGDPYERDPQLVAEDVRQGYVSRDAARSAYGVVFANESLKVDQRATEALREERAGDDRAPSDRNGALAPPQPGS